MILAGLTHNSPTPMAEHHHPPQSACAQAACWEKIDAVVCINLDRRADRWASFCANVPAALPLEKICRMSAVEGIKLPGYGQAPWFTERTGRRSRYWGGVAGCTLSHVKAIRLAQQKGWRNLLILEDDIGVQCSTEALGLLQRALETAKGQWLLYLGYSGRPYGTRLAQEGEAALWQIEGALTTHAYIVPETMYQPLLAALPPDEASVWEWLSIHRAIDTFYKDEVAAWSGVTVYALQPHIFYQNGMSGDLATGTGGAPIACAPPRELRGLRGLVRRLFAPLRRLKTRLNSIRTHRRARAGGFPGYRKKRPQP